MVESAMVPIQFSQQQQEPHSPRSQKRHIQQQQQQQQQYRNGDSSIVSNDSIVSSNSNINNNHNELQVQIQQIRPYDTLGIASDPIEFPRPQLLRGRRDTVVCYNSITDDHEILENVLFRDYYFNNSHHNQNTHTHTQNHTNHHTNTTSTGNHHHTSHQQQLQHNNHGVNTNSNNHNTTSDIQRQHPSSSRTSSNNKNTNNNANMKAYWPIPFKAKIQTIMGHVEMCRVLKRCTRQRDDDDDDDYSSSNDGYDDDDDEIVFEFTDQYVAVKVNYTDRMDRLRDRHAENPLQEIAAMQLLGNNPLHVLGAIDVLFDGQNLNLVMRYCDSGDLFQLLQDRQSRLLETTTTIDTTPSPPGLPEGEVRYWFRQIMKGVQYIHSCGICHRDLSPENIMIDGTEGVIIDMGMCIRVPYIDPNNPNLRTDISKTNPTTRTRCLIKPQGACGKLPYMCPEILASRHPFDGEAADVWTSGTILFCMITGNRSYQRPHMTDPQFYWMTQGLRQLLSDWNVTISEEGILLLQGMLEIDPRKRLTLDEVCNHPWFQYPDVPPPIRMDMDDI